MLTQDERPSRALAAALALAQDPDWLAHAAARSGIAPGGRLWPNPSFAGGFVAA
jgi:hypothetical protein